ncbi:hypothetical protein ACWGJ2_04410 [Streptomyces sp. NPDC054796]
MNQKATRTPRAVLAVEGARVARQQAVRRDVIARQLDAIAPGTARVRTVPVQLDDRLVTWVTLADADGRPVAADRDAHRAARGLLRRLLPSADWTGPLVYDAITGELSVDAPELPEELRA